MSNLLIVESPGKIKKISEYLGNDYIVMASIGHIIDLDGKTMSINMDNFEPEYIQYPDKIDVIKKLKSAAIKVGKDNVYLAADEDREGEMIAWSVAKELGIKNEKRIVFNSITSKELKNAIANVKKIDINMVYAQQARRILDRLAGYLISPLLYKNGFKGAQSAGRVQSVVVKIIVDKEKEIQEFYKKQKSTYFYITCLINLGEHEILTKLTNSDENIELSEPDEFEKEENEIIDINEKENSKSKKKGKKNTINTENKVSTKSYLTFDKEDEQLVIKIIKAMCKGTYNIINMTDKIKKSNAPAPFTTSTLQQYASQRLSMDAKRTMSVAQKLYEGGHITYMRTDSTSISEEAIKVIEETISTKYSKTYFEEHKFINKKANTQEAHECIRPTKPMYNEIEGTNDEKRLYNIIWKRTIQSQMKAAEYQTILIEIKINDKKEILVPYKLVGTLENLIYEGYLIVDNKKGSKPIDKKTLNNINWIEINGIEDTAKPPVRYNDASLINKMDPKNLNIGRPSTYASFIDKITNRNYVNIQDIEGTKIQVNKYTVISNKTKTPTIDVETKDLIIGKEKKKLVPTALGINITEFLEKNFSLLMDYKFTAEMEEELDDIAEGKILKLNVIKNFYDYLTKQINDIKPIEITLNQSVILGKLESGIEVKLANGKFGKYLICGEKNLNLKYLLLNNEYNLTENDIETNQNKILELVEKKLLNTNEDNKKSYNNDNSKVTKEWKKGKIKYILKHGQYGYYIEEINSTGKKNNWAMSFLINKTAKNNFINDIESNINDILEKISIDDIQTNINYLKNKKK